MSDGGISSQLEIVKDDSLNTETLEMKGKELGRFVNYIISTDVVYP